MSHAESNGASGRIRGGIDGRSHLRRDSGGHAGSDKDMVLIPKGEFTMGSNEHSDEAKHQVVLDAYLIDKFEASNARYKEFMKATGHPAPAYWDDPRLE